jgi:Fe-S cluster assembly ATPase SufC
MKHDDESSNQIQEKLNELNLDHKKLEDNKQQYSIQKNIQDLASTLLKDNGVKTRIIKQYLPLINKHTNIFLNAMNFFVTFNIDEEFNESIKSRNRDDFSYENFSEGEKQRIDLALLFTWRTIAKMKNSVNTNLLIMDEVLDSYLDTFATENVLQLLNSDMFKDSNIFVISHKDTISDKFKKTIKCTKSKNFSIIS